MASATRQLMRTLINAFRRFAMQWIDPAAGIVRNNDWHGTLWPAPVGHNRDHFMP
jgi:hypothetical protein